MWTQCYKRYDEKDDKLKYIKLTETGSLIVSIGHDGDDCNWTITDYKIQDYDFDEPISESEFRLIYRLVQLNYRKRFELNQ